MWKALATILVASIPLVALQINRTGWTLTVDSFQTGTNNEAAKLLDGDTGTFWHTQWMPSAVPLPHTVTLDMKKSFNVNGLTYLPRQDGSSNGNIGQHSIQISTDGATWTEVAKGTYLDDSSLKTTPFTTIPARYVRIIAQTEAGNRGAWTSAAEINVLAAVTYAKPPTNLGILGTTVDFPIVPAAAAVLTNGKVLLWSSWKALDFGEGGGSGTTQTAIYDPATGTVLQRTVTETQHDMFCPGLSLDASGRPFVTDNLETMHKGFDVV